MGREALDRIALPLSRRIKAKSNRKTRAGKSIGRLTLIKFKSQVSGSTAVFFFKLSHEITLCRRLAKKKSAITSFNDQKTLVAWRIREFLDENRARIGARDDHNFETEGEALESGLRWTIKGRDAVCVA